MPLCVTFDLYGGQTLPGFQDDALYSMKAQTVMPRQNNLRQPASRRDFDRLSWNKILPARDLIMAMAVESETDANAGGVSERLEIFRMLKLSLRLGIHRMVISHAVTNSPEITAKGAEGVRGSS